MQRHICWYFRLNGTDHMNDEMKFHTINAIKKIRMLYKQEFVEYL